VEEQVKERRQNSWIISSTESIVSKVYFEDSLTKEEAMEAYLNGGLIDDVLDSNVSHVVSVEDAEPWGDEDDDSEGEEE
jgi:hypothetical protein